jgi:hypothetical protein
MPLTIPDIQNVTNGSNGFDAQAITDFTDISALAGTDSGNGVISGCQVTAQSSANMTVQVAAGNVLINGAVVTVAGVSSLTISAADATDRRDIVTVNSSGTVSVTKGTDCGTAGWTRTSTGLGPIKPSIPSNSALLAEVFVGSSTSAINTINIVDKTNILLAVPGQLLARAFNAPSTATTYSPVVVTTGLTALDTTNLKVTFVGPPSGEVEVQLSGYVSSTTADKELYFGVVSSTASPGTLVGVLARVYGTPSVVTDTPGCTVLMSQLISVTPGTSYTWYFAAATTTAAEPTIIAQGGAAVTTAATGAPAFIKVYAA